MAQRRFTLTMPGTAEAAFEAFHNHAKRLEWDTLLSAAYVEGGGSHPYVGAISFNLGRGWKRLFAMRTRFVNYQQPSMAAAVIDQPAGLFELWAASMRHVDVGDGTSLLHYTFNIRLRPRWLGAVLDPVAIWLFEYESRRRFAAMANYLAVQRHSS
jgi:hypothetical protein